MPAKSGQPDTGRMRLQSTSGKLPRGAGFRMVLGFRVSGLGCCAQPEVTRVLLPDLESSLASSTLGMYFRVLGETYTPLYEVYIV